VSVRALRLLVIEVEAHHVERLKRVQFTRLADAVVVRVAPQPQAREDRIPAINHAVRVAAFDGFVEGRECAEAVGRAARGLRREVAEEFAPAVYPPVAVAV
jgi:hypothetical protein